MYFEIIVIAITIILALCIGLFFAWKIYQDYKFESMWDGKTWDEAKYQKKIKEWEKEVLLNKLAKRVAELEEKIQGQPLDEKEQISR